jgi:hypothetical protein
MATFTKIYSFVEALAEKSHNLGSDQLVIALTNTAHTTSWTQLSDLTQVSYANCSTRNITTTSSTQTTGTYKLVLQDLTLTATGTVGPFRYVYIYNDTSTNDLLVGYYDYGSSVTLASGDSFAIDFDAAAGAITIA